METKEILNSLYAIRAGLSVIAKNIDSFYDEKLKWLKDIYNIADDHTLDYWTKYNFHVVKHKKVKKPPLSEEIKGNYADGWIIGSSFFHGNSSEYTSYYLGGYEKYRDFAESKDFDPIINYENLREHFSQYIFEKEMDDFVHSNKKPLWDDGRKVTYAEYKERTIDMLDFLVDQFIRNNFPRKRYWNAENDYYDYFTGNFKSDILIDFFTFAHWLNTDDCKKYLNERENYFMSEKIGLISKKIKYPAYLKIIQDAQAKLPELIEKVKVADKKYTEMSECIMPACKKIYNALVANYSELLDVRDWKYLDLVIFAIETRRADNIKEALTFVDGEVRTKRITSMIEKAARQICETISIGMAALQNTMVSCCNSINAHITAVGGELSAKLDRAISATEMSNALLTKANVSSERLLN